MEKLEEKTHQKLEEKAHLSFNGMKLDISAIEGNKENIKENTIISDTSCFSNISESNPRKSPESNIVAFSPTVSLKKPSEQGSNNSFLRPRIEENKFKKDQTLNENSCESDSFIINQRRNKSKKIIRRYLEEVESDLDVFKVNSAKNDVIPPVSLNKIYDIYYKIREAKILKVEDNPGKAVVGSSFTRFNRPYNNNNDVRSSHNSLYMGGGSFRKNEMETGSLFYLGNPQTKKNKSILDWLEEISLEVYASNFISKCFLDQTSLQKLNLTDELLKTRFEIGKLGHRLKILYKCEDGMIYKTNFFFYYIFSIGFILKIFFLCKCAF